MTISSSPWGVDPHTPGMVRDAHGRRILQAGPDATSEHIAGNMRLVATAPELFAVVVLLRRFASIEEQVWQTLDDATLARRTRTLLNLIAPLTLRLYSELDPFTRVDAGGPEDV